MSENKKMSIIGLGQIVQGYYKVSVVDENNNVVYEQPDWKKNLIVNGGMDALNDYPYATAFYWGDAGSGARENSISSGTTTATADGAGNVALATVGTLTSFTMSVSGYNTSSQVGDMIKFSDGTEARILTAAGAALTVTPSITIAPDQTFVIWKTSQTSLHNHLKYAGSYGITDSVIVQNWPYTGTTQSIASPNVMQMRRTFDFPKQSIGDGAVSYTEVGTRTGAGIGGSILFSRIKLTNPVFVDVGQRLRLSYELQVAFYPTTSVNRPNVVVTGWPVSPATNTNASESIQNFLGQGSYINGNYIAASYVLGNGDVAGGALLEPYNAPTMFISTSTASLVAFNAVTPDRSTSNTYASTAKSAYTPLSFYNDRSVTFTEAQANYSNIGSMGVGWLGTYRYPAESGAQCFVMVFEQTQSKTNTQTLTLGWRCTWGRVLA